MKQISNYICEGLRINKNTTFNKKFECIYMLDNLIDDCSKGNYKKDFINELIELKKNIISGKILNTLGHQAKWIGIYTEGEEIEGVTEADVKEWESWDDVNGGELTELRDLKVGDYYDSDGGLHIYIRIRK